MFRLMNAWSSFFKWKINFMMDTVITAQPGIPLTEEDQQQESEMGNVIQALVTPYPPVPIIIPPPTDGAGCCGDQDCNCDCGCGDGDDNCDCGDCDCGGCDCGGCDCNGCTIL